MTPEAKVKAKINALLKAYDVYYYSMAGTQFGAPSLDYYCCHRGWFLAIEAKAPGKKPTPRQRETARRIQESGGLAVWVSNDRDLKMLEVVLATLPRRTANAIGG